MEIKAKKEFQSGEDFLWVSKFNDESLREFYSEFTRLERDPSTSIILVVVSSYGGDVHSVFGMRDIIKSSTKPVATFCTGKAMSAGALLLAAGTKGYRYASPSSRIMVHEVSGYDFSGKTQEMKESTKELALVNEMFLQAIAEDTGNNVKFLKERIKDMSNADWFMSAEAAKAMGLVDEIAVPRPIEQHALQGIRVPGKRKKKR